MNNKTYVIMGVLAAVMLATSVAGLSSNAFAAGTVFGGAQSGGVGNTAGAGAAAGDTAAGAVAQNNQLNGPQVHCLGTSATALGIAASAANC